MSAFKVQVFIRFLNFVMKIPATEKTRSDAVEVGLTVSNA